MIKMTTVQLVEAIREKKGAELVTIKTETIPTLNAAGKAKFGQIFKQCHMNIMIGFDYENCVNNQKGREQAELDFVSAPRRWGTRPDLKTVEHNGQTYISANCLKTFDVEYIGQDGETIDAELVKPYLPKKSASRQDVQKEVIYRDFKVQSIKQINFRGIQVEVSHY